MARMMVDLPLIAGVLWRALFQLLADEHCRMQVCMKRPGWKETDKDDWDFIWADKDWIRMHFDECRHHLSATVPPPP